MILESALSLVRAARRLAERRRPAADTLTPHQLDAFDQIYSFVTRGHRRDRPARGNPLMSDSPVSGLPWYTLAGFAGTGKSFLLSVLIRELLRDGIPLFATATTHKATRVLEQSVAEKGTRLPAEQVRTTQSLLGLRLVPDGDGGFCMAPDPDPALPSGAVVVCDEASMAGRLVCGEAAASTRRGVTWLFCGDPAQLPPVGEARSMVFDLAGATLEEVVRQSTGSPIVELATCIRARQPVQLQTRMDGDHGVAVTASERTFLDSALRAIEEDAQRGSTGHTRILAYTNRRVRWWNRLVRERLFGREAPAYLPGDFVTALDGWAPPEGASGGPVLAKSRELVVTEAEVATRIAPSLPRQSRAWTCYLLTLADPLRSVAIEVPVVHESERALMREALRARYAAAHDGEGSWEAFHELKGSFAHVGHAYATTIHRSQGSTYYTTFLDWADTTRCRGWERRCLRYVGVTRPSHRLALLIGDRAS
jgi:exodeoxyribonuclease-5